MRPLLPITLLLAASLARAEGGGNAYSGIHLRSGDFLHFALSAPDRIETFQISAGSWLSPIDLPGPARSLTATSGRISVSTPTQLIAASRSAPTVQVPVGRSFDQLFVQQGILYARTAPATYSAYHPDTLEFLKIITLPAPLSSIAADSPFALTPTQNGSALSAITTLPGGGLSVETGAEVAGLPAGAGIFPFPDSKRLVTSDGTVFSSTGLSRIGHWDRAIDGLTFRGDVPIAICGSEIVAYSNLLRAVSTYPLARPPATIVAADSGLLVFFPDATSAHGFVTETIGYPELGAPEPGAALRIEDAYVENVEFVTSITDYLVSPFHQAAFQWVWTSQAWEDGVALDDVPAAAGIYTPNHTTVTGGRDGRLYGLRGNVVSNGALARLPGPIVKITTGPSISCVIATTGAIPQLQLLGENFRRDDAIAEIFDPASLVSLLFGERVYFRSGEFIASWEVGFVDGRLNFLQRREHLLPAGEFGIPLALDAAESRLLLTSGHILDAETLMPISGERITASFSAAAWIGDQLHLASETAAGHTKIETRNVRGELEAVLGLPGRPLGFWPGLRTRNRLATVENGSTRVFELNSRAGVYRIESDPPIPLSPVITAPAAGTLSIDLATVFGKSTTWELFNYSDLRVASPQPTPITAMRLDLESDSLALDIDPYNFGTVEIRLAATNASQRIEGSLFVDVPAPAAPEIEILAPPSLNRDTGLFEQQVRVTNAGDRPLGAFAISVSNLQAGTLLYNRSASGADGSQAVWVEARLEPGAATLLTLEFFTPDRQPPSGLVFAAAALPRFVIATDAFAIGRVRLGGGGLQFDFPSTPGGSYRIQRSRDAAHWSDVPTAVRAAGHRVQWSDTSRPAGSQFFRARKL